MGGPVAKLRTGLSGVAERTVERRSVLHGIRENPRVGQSGRLEGGADGRDAPVHHVGCTDVIGAGFPVRSSDVDQHVDGRIVDDFTVVHEPAVTVVGGGAQAHIGHHHKVVTVFGLEFHHGPMEV